MASLFGNHVQYSIFGEETSEYIGIVIEGLPAGEYIDPYDIKEYIARCSRGKKAAAFGSSDGDDVQFLAGAVDNTTCGTPLFAVISNPRRRPRAEDEDNEGLLRPDEGDMALWLRHGQKDGLWGSHLSERTFTALCLGGAIAKKLLEKQGIVVGAHIETLGSIHDRPFDPMNVTAEELKDPGRYPFPTLNFNVGQTMEAQIDLMAKKGDSIGGIIEGGVVGLPGGLGDPLFDGLDGVLAKHLFAVPGVKGVEFGSGFDSVKLRGSQYGDEICLREGALATKTNRCGGVVWGVSTGMPLILRAAVRPSPRIPGECTTVDVGTMTEAVLTSEDHVACSLPQMVPVVESVMAMTILDFMMVK